MANASIRTPGAIWARLIEQQSANAKKPGEKQDLGQILAVPCWVRFHKEPQPLFSQTDAGMGMSSSWVQEAAGKARFSIASCTQPE
jgi:hypothetical protein